MLRITVVATEPLLCELKDEVDFMLVNRERAGALDTICLLVATPTPTTRGWIIRSLRLPERTPTCSDTSRKFLQGRSSHHRGRR